jgi:hypothetical protein
MATDVKSLPLGFIVFCEDKYSHLSPQKIIAIASESSKLVEEWGGITEQERSEWTACAERLVQFKFSTLVEQWKNIIDTKEDES